MTVSAGFCSNATDTSKGTYNKEWIRGLLKDAQMGDIYLSELLRADSALTLYKALVHNKDSIIEDHNRKDSFQNALIGNMQLQADNLSKQLEFQAAWTKALDKEFHKLKVKNFFQQSGLMAVIGGLVYLLVRK
jgi:hypothetical protein